MTKYYIEMKETKRNMMSDALLSLYRKKGPESEEARQMGLKLWDFDLKEKRMEITSDEQRVLRHALNDLRNQRLEEGKYTDGVEAAIMEVMKPHRTKHFRGKRRGDHSDIRSKTGRTHTKDVSRRNADLLR